MTVRYNSNSIDLDNLFIRKELFSSGGLWLWGNNSYGQLGDNTVVHKSSPVQTISGGTNWKSISSGRYHTAAIKADGTLWLWGLNSSGQLGDNTVTSRSSPVQTVSSGSNWDQVSCGGDFTGAIKTDGSLWIWGNNTYGQIGDNTVTNRSSPVQTISSGFNWKQISCGSQHTAAIKTDGTLWLWGRNDDAELGDYTLTDRSSPVETYSHGVNWKLVSSGWNNTAAVKTDGTLWLWGANSWGQLGNGSTLAGTDISSPIQTISAGTNWKQVAVGTDHVSSMKTNGTLWTWGNNGDANTAGNGKLGDGTTALRSSPVQTISAGTSWKLTSCGRYHTAGIKTDGTLWLWGGNAYGRLGDNTVTTKSSPVQTISAGTDWLLVSCGNYHTAGIRSV